MTPLLLYPFILALFVAVDAIWLTYVSAPEFRATLGDALLETPIWAAAILFYVLFGAALWWFAVFPGVTQGHSLWWIALNGAFVGLVAYGTYDLTNMSTLKGWTWHLVAVDVAWGTALSGVVSAVAGIVGRAFLTPSA
jgi:uncharacterized membrane protein